MSPTSSGGFVGNITGGVTGNADTATQLRARSIAGVAFDGTSDISLNNNAHHQQCWLRYNILYQHNQLTNGAGLSVHHLPNVVEDTTPQLGGNLDLQFQEYYWNWSNYTGDGHVNITGVSTFNDQLKMADNTKIILIKGNDICRFCYQGPVTYTGFLASISSFFSGYNWRIQLDPEVFSVY